MTRSDILITPHLRPIALSEIPTVAETAWHNSVVNRVRDGWRLASLFAVPEESSGLRLFAILAHDNASELGVISTPVLKRYLALTPQCPSAHWFEREIAEEWGLQPVGHPWLKPIRFTRGNSPYVDASRPVIGLADYFTVRGQEVHEVGVGPVHAGVIEPGHFRFQCHGEDVFHLEISLGYQHRGIEKRLRGGPDKRTRHYMETLAGDTSIGHTLAYCHVLESLSGITVPEDIQRLRVVALELERLANHTGDLGALANDVAFLPTASFCGRLRGDFLNMTALLCGNRFGRGFLRAGGTAFGLDLPRRDELRRRMKATFTDVADAAHLLFKTPSVLARFHETGLVSHEHATEIGLVGTAARASGVRIDNRAYFPTDAYPQLTPSPAMGESGDVFSRAWIRWLEIDASAAMIDECLRSLENDVRPTPNFDAAPRNPNALVISLTEGWRGEICHAALTDAQGNFRHYKVTDPSFHNWFGLALALRDEAISDFPLCNKSFNLSYCGHDL
jgi:Ni,Fe-hydrogenase III large subunit